ncbi:pilin [Aestuariibacter sp. A3R04]|uniref:pilin n=1 Tax=Aestuariibacter sp. A3R04 TaxID=2841571 RepID=UPI001C08E01E|nr:pilin [Aestuariibacter sp. A3R04]MBU3021607.1 pilin [Aestuariibacter sp. A3R04]
MKENQIRNRQSGLTTSEMVVYPLIVLVLVAVAFGFYHNARIDEAVSAAVELGLEQQAIVEEYFYTHGEMPQSESDINLSTFAPNGILTGMEYRAGELGVPAADKFRTGTFRALVDMTEFGGRFKDIESGFLLIARAQDDDTIKWDCVADEVTVDALKGRYLPETCSRAKDDEEGDGAELEVE